AAVGSGAARRAGPTRRARAARRRSLFLRGRLRLLRLGRRRAPSRREARGRAGAALGGAVRLRVDVDGEPLGSGAAVSGRVVVEEGGGAFSLSVRLAFVERSESFEKVARE